MMSKIKMTLLFLVASFVATGPVFAGKTTVNGWYEGEEIYYIDQGIEEGVTERGENDIYLIGGRDCIRHKWWNSSLVNPDIHLIGMSMLFILHPE